MNHVETVEIPGVPFGPEGSPRKADARYYRDAARNIRHQASLGHAFSGSNLTETVAKLCDAAAEALERQPMHTFNESDTNGGRGPWCHHTQCRHWFESECEFGCNPQTIHSSTLGETK